MSAFVERERGLEFKESLKITVLADAEFERSLKESGAPDKNEVDDAEAVLQAIGLIPRDLDLAKAVAAADVATVGFYDSEKKELVVKGQNPTALVRRTIVHELTHALDDQHFGIDREFESDEAATGWESLIEGSAVLVEQRYVRSLSRSERQEMQKEEADLLRLRGDLPSLVEESLAFPYVFGPALVEELLARGGQGRLDAAFSTPPLSSEQVINPALYLARDDPIKVPVPDADGVVADEGEIGQLLLTLILRSHLDEETALMAAAGWGGDRYVAWTDDADRCVRMAFVMDTPADTRQLESALSDWSGRREGSTVSGTSLTTCG